MPCLTTRAYPIGPSARLPAKEAGMTRPPPPRLTRGSLQGENMNQSRRASTVSGCRNNTSARVRTWSLLRLHAVGAAAAILMLAGFVAQAPAASASAGRAARPARPELTGAIAPRPLGNGHRQRPVKLPPTVSVGNGPDGGVTDPATHTLYTSNQNDNSVSVINTATLPCRGYRRLRSARSLGVAAGWRQPAGDRHRHGHRHRVRGQHRRQHDLGDQHQNLQRSGLLRLRPGPGQRQGPARAQ